MMEINHPESFLLASLKNNPCIHRNFQFSKRFGSHEALLPYPQQYYGNVVIFLREPRRRILSHVNMVSGSELDHAYVDFLEDGNLRKVDRRIMTIVKRTVPNHQHFQSGFITGANVTQLREDLMDVCDILKEIYFIGIVEYYEASVCLFLELAGVPSQNMSTYSKKMRDGRLLPGSHIAYNDKNFMSRIILNYTAHEDSYIYNCALTLLRNRLAKSESCQHFLDVGFAKMSR